MSPRPLPPRPAAPAPLRPQTLRAEDIYPAEHFRDGARPDTQPISREAYAAMQRAARVARRASGGERLGRGLVYAVAATPLAALLAAGGACAQGLHGAAIGAALGGLWAAVRACAGFADASPL